MDSQLLSICIPSYNRLEKAKKCALSILNQIGTFPVDVIVLDNASRENYVESFYSDDLFKESLSKGTLKVLRNTANIGMSANFLRAFEIADGEWMWLVSDDDDIRQNALEELFSGIEKFGNQYGFIKFSSPRSRPDNDSLFLNSLESLIDYNYKSANDFNGFIFISNGIYNLNEFRPYLSIGYQYANTYIPHFMMIVYYMAGGGSSAISRKEIVDYVVPEVGYSYGMLAGLGVGAPKHSILNLNKEYYEKYLKIFFPHNDYKVIIDLYYQCKRDANLSVLNYLVKSYINYVSDARSFPNIVFLRSFYVLTKFPVVFENMIYVFSKFSSKISSQVSEIKERYS